jgi:DNA-binding LytR/AlgR family response regulator
MGNATTPVATREVARDAARVLIADDEPLLAQALARELAALWPQASIETIVHDGTAALAAIVGTLPDVAFLDVRMPGLRGLEVAQAVAEDWSDAKPAPLIVFVTAFEQFALDAFERAAVDYVVKPVRAERLAVTVQRLRERLAQRSPTDTTDELAQRIGQLLAATHAAGGTAAGGSAAGTPRLRTIRAGVGQTVKMIPIEQVVLLRAADKYVEVISTAGEALIRQSLRDLLTQLDPERFVQIHRGTVVNMDHVHAADRDEQGRITLQLRGRDERPAVSRVYAELFRPM